MDDVLALAHLEEIRQVYQEALEVFITEGWERWLKDQEVRSKALVHFSPHVRLHDGRIEAIFSKNGYRVGHCYQGGICPSDHTFITYLGRPCYHIYWVGQFQARQVEPLVTRGEDGQMDYGEARRYEEQVMEFLKQMLLEEDAGFPWRGASYGHDRGLLYCANAVPGLLPGSFHYVEKIYDGDEGGAVIYVGHVFGQPVVGEENPVRE